MNLTKKRKKKGFTLIELMAVIAIIAILAAVLVPTVSGYINRSKKTAIITQVRNVVSALETYNATAANPILDEVDSSNVDENGVISTNGGDTTMTVVDLANTVGEDLLDINAIGKLGNMRIGTAKLINSNSNAIKDIGLYPDGVFGSYGKQVENHSELVKDDSPGAAVGAEKPKYSISEIK